MSPKHCVASCLLASCIAVSALAQKKTGDGTVLIEGGTFFMGTERAIIPDLKERYDVNFPGVFENEAPLREVTVRDFRIDQYEVTNARFAEFLNANSQWDRAKLAIGMHNGDYLKIWASGLYPNGLAHYPVVFVTWSAAQSYCRWRGGRLPSEAEWEYVARAGDSREFPWGDDLPTPLRANYSASGNQATVEVGTYPPNEFGVYDLAGNVWEFLYDAWVPELVDGNKENPIAGGLLSDKDVLTVDGRRSVRGASFGGSIVNLRTRWRDSHVATNAIEFVGFRCAYPK